MSLFYFFDYSNVPRFWLAQDHWYFSQNLLGFWNRGRPTCSIPGWIRNHWYQYDRIIL